MQYLSKMTDEQTVKMYSGHPTGLFPYHSQAPREVAKTEWLFLLIYNPIYKNE
jgi:urocanate hydratase